MNTTVRKAIPSDVLKIHKLLNPYARDGVILERTIDDIKTEIDKFFIAEREGEVIGVISYYDYGKDLKEVRSLAVKKEFYRRKTGTALLRNLVEFLHKGFPSAKIFALSYYPDFFIGSGFVRVDKDTLPEKIWKDCRYCKDRDNCGETALVLPAGSAVKTAKMA